MVKDLDTINSSFWKDKRIFITGHTGFKGSWATIWLHHLGAKVFGYSLPAPTVPSLYHAARVSSLLSGEKIDNVCNYESVLESMKKAKPTIVIHMAAQPLVRHSYETPLETYNTNVMGTIHVLEAIRHTGGVRAALIVTSDKCYENREIEIGYTESDPMGGHDPYSSSKGCAELAVSAWQRSFLAKMEIFSASARAGNVIGGGDWAKDRLVPDLIKHFSKHQPVVVRNPDAIRPWQHVLEPLSGYLLLIEKLFNHGTPYAEAWNFGPKEHDAKTVQYIADNLTALWGENCEWRSANCHHQPHESRYLNLSINKAEMKLGWQPRLNIDDALNLTCQWYKKFYESQDCAYDLTLEQISKYEQIHDSKKKQKTQS